MANVLYYGDNFEVLRRHIKDESIDLVYLDPPFNSNQSYNVLFAEHSGAKSSSQIRAFEDTWEWNQTAAESYRYVVEQGGEVARVMQAFHTFLGDSNMMAYLSMMAPRLGELHRVLKSTGSLYLHCDPTSSSHCLKLLLDAVFDPRNFLTEIIWKRSTAHSDSRQGRRQHGRVHDTLLFYSKTNNWFWLPLHMPHAPTYLASHYRLVEPETGRRYQLTDITGPGGAAKGNPQYEVMGVTKFWRYSREKMEELIQAGRIVQPRPGAVPRYKRYLDEMPGLQLQDIWTDISPINSQAAERLGYPTQKPEALMERIIQTSSSEGDTVLDPFCGCGTTVALAQRLKRNWIGIDITHLAINLIRHRLQDTYGETIISTYEVIGEPTSIEGAEQLAVEDPYQFQWWALGLVGARPAEGKKGADKGIDGGIYFHDEGPKGETKQIIFSVKAGKPGLAHIHELRGVITREEAQIGVYISMQKPTGPMKREAAGAGFYESPWGNHPRLQLLTVEELLDGRRIDAPPLHQASATFRRAPKARDDQSAPPSSLFED